MADPSDRAARPGQASAASAGDTPSRLEFLARASETLAAAQTDWVAVDRLAHLAVPAIADWCAIDVLDDGRRLKRVAVVHADPAKVAIASELERRYPPDPDASYGVYRVIRTGTSVLYTEINDAQIRRAARDVEHLALLRALGVFGSAMIVPLATRARTLGAMTLVSVNDGRRFGRAELSLAEDLARRAALAVDNARLYGERSHVARTLQRSLLPPHLPRIPGVEVAARYQAAGEGNEVGGDFYDLFRTGKDDWAILIGDVCGKGADAAGLTALARYTVRAAAMQARKPSRVLGLLNDALLAETTGPQGQQERLCTVAYTRLRPTETGVRITSASGGHPQPLIIRADGRVEAACGPGTLLGAIAEPRLADRTTELARGDVLLFYTDGVTEARGRQGTFGEEDLHNLLKTCSSLDAATIAEKIEGIVLDFQEGNPRDDIALLVVRVRE